MGTSPFQTLFVTTRARPDSGSREAATLCRSSSPLRWLGGNQLSSNVLHAVNSRRDHWRVLALKSPKGRGVQHGEVPLSTRGLI